MLPRSRAGLAGAVAHLLVLGSLVTLMLRSRDPGWPRFWTIMLALDFPVSLGIVPVTWLAPPAAAGPLADVANFWWPLAWHGLIGTLWWYIVGWAIARKISRALERRGSGGEENG